MSEQGDGWWRGDIVWRTDPVQLRGGAYGSGDATVWAGASGSLVLMDGALFTANRVSDSFVVVSTDGTPDIPVRYENQLVGKTNADGKLLIPWASAYYPGKYEIDPLDLPANVLVPTVMQTVAVARGSGTVVRFPVDRRAAARAILRGPDGLPLAAGTPVLINDEVTTYVGWDGLLFVEQAKAASRLAVRFADGSRCTASFAVPQDAGDIFDIGDLTCAPAAN